MMDLGLTVQAKAEGFTEAEKDIGKVLGALDGMKASQKDWLGVLAEIDPRLAHFARSLSDAVKVSGDLASANVNLSQVFTTAKAAITDYIGPLKLLGAVGAVIAGIKMVSASIADMRAEFEAATRSIRANADALTDLQKTRMGRSAGLERLSGLRREGGVTAEESRRIAIAAGGIIRRVPVSSEEERTRLSEAASQAALIAGPEADTGTLDDLSIVLANVKGIDVEKLVKPGPARAASRVQRLIGRHRKLIDTTRVREAEQAGVETPAAAVGEAAAGGVGGQAFIEEFIRGLPGEAFTGQNIPMLAKIAATLPSLSPEDLQDAQLSVGYLMKGDPFDAKFAGLQTKARALRAKGIEGVEPEHVRTGEFIQRQLEKQDTSNLRGDAGEVHHHTHHYYNHNQRFMYPDRQSMARNTVNGESRARDAEELMIGWV